MAKPSRILQLANQPGPLVLFEMPVCDALRRRGHHVELACMRTSALADRLDVADFPLHWLPAGPWTCPLTWARTYRAVRRLLARGRYDALVVHTPAMGWLARLAARRLVPVVIHVAHGLPFAPGQPAPVHLALREVERFAGRFCDALLVMNADDARACRRWRLPNPRGTWTLLPGVGVDIDAWAAPLDPRDRAELDARFALRPDRPLVLFLGRMIPAKGPRIVLQLARRLGPRADVLLAGEGPLLDEVRRRAAEIGPHVHAPGWCDRPDLLVKRADLAAFPSTFREGLPRFPQEALAAGKPVVAFDVRGTSDLLATGAGGLLVPPGDVDAFGDAVAALLDDPARAAALGAAGPPRIRERFSLDAAVSAQVRAIEAAIDRGRTR